MEKPVSPCDLQNTEQKKSNTKIEIRWFGVCSFEIVLNGKHILTDPYITEHKRNNGLTFEVVEQCDAILTSHGHSDHITDIPKLVDKFSPKLFAGSLTATILAEYSNSIPMRTYPMTPGLELDFNDYKIKSMFARHINLGRKFSEAEARIDAGNGVKLDPSECFRRLQTLGNMEYTNYIITAGEKKIVFYGGSPLPEQINMYKGENPDLALVQLLSQSVQRTATLIKSMGAKNVIPTHLDFTADRSKYIIAINDLRAELKGSGINVIEPLYNKWMEF